MFDSFLNAQMKQLKLESAKPFLYFSTLRHMSSIFHTTSCSSLFNKTTYSITSNKHKKNPFSQTEPVGWKHITLIDRENAQQVQ